MVPVIIVAAAIVVGIVVICVGLHDHVAALLGEVEAAWRHTEIHLERSHDSVTRLVGTLGAEQQALLIPTPSPTEIESALQAARQARTAGEPQAVAQAEAHLYAAVTGTLPEAGERDAGVQHWLAQYERANRRFRSAAHLYERTVRRYRIAIQRPPVSLAAALGGFRTPPLMDADTWLGSEQSGRDHG